MRCASLCGTFRNEMNTLPVNKKIQILSALTEGVSIRGTSRMTGAHIVTILRLLREAGIRCGELMEEKMKGIHPDSVQCDEIWTFIGKKDARLNGNDGPDAGSHFIFVALESKTKLIPCFTLGKRDETTAYRFMSELRRRTIGRYQITTDSFGAYRTAVGLAFNWQVDYGQLVKSYRSNGHQKREGYSPSQFVDLSTKTIFGNPDPKKISTSYVERSNLSMRMGLRRLTRLTNAYSKKRDNLWAALALYFAWYNFGRIHQTLGKTPAMAAGITDHPWTLAEIMGWEDLSK